MGKIAILLATYNGEAYLAEQLESLQKQTCQDFVCYIHDDASRDHTVEIIQNYCKADPEHFVQVEGPSTGGARNNFMYLVEKAGIHHPYLMFCDQDDVWLPEKVEKSVKAVREIEKDPQTPCLAFCDMKVVDQNLQIISPSFTDYNQLHEDKITFDRAVMKGYAAGCSMILNQTLARSMILKDYHDISMHDSWAMMIAAASGEIYRIPEALTLYRQHGNNELGAQHVTKLSRIKQIVKRIVHFEQYKITQRGLYSRINQLKRCKEVTAVYEQCTEMIDGAWAYSDFTKIQKCRYILKNKLYQNKWSKFWTCICA